MEIIEIINVPPLIGAIGILLFFIWLGRYTETQDKKHEITKSPKDLKTNHLDEKTLKSFKVKERKL